MAGLTNYLFAAVNLVHAFLFGGPIDGTAWDVKVKQDGWFHWGTERDTLVFHNGKLVVAGAVGKGYSPVLYESRDADQGTVFEAVLDDPAKEIVEWSGVVEGEKISGVVVVRARDGKTVRYAFSGAKKPS